MLFPGGITPLSQGKWLFQSHIADYADLKWPRCMGAMWWELPKTTHTYSDVHKWPARKGAMRTGTFHQTNINLQREEPKARLPHHNERFL
jgi:hypothetical protein